MVVLVVIVIPIPNPLEWLGLTVPNQFGWIILVALLFGVVLSTYLLKRSPGAMASMQRSLQASSVLLPANDAERRWFGIAAVTAGICEELLYRGFLMSYLPSNFSMLAGQLILISHHLRHHLWLEPSIPWYEGDCNHSTDRLQLCNCVCLEREHTACHGFPYHGGAAYIVVVAA